jgi:thymidine kinase
MSGKTTRLKIAFDNAVSLKKKVEVFDHPGNTRNSKRDISNILPGVLRLQEAVDIGNYDLVIFDEVHLYAVFKNEHVLLDTLKTADSTRTKCILSGIYFDFYDHYRPFQIWERIAPVSTCHLLSSMNPCPCGNDKHVYYSANDGSTIERVGDHYINVCDKCKEGYYKRYQEILKDNRRRKC